MSMSPSTPRILRHCETPVYGGSWWPIFRARVVGAWRASGGGGGRAPAGTSIVVSAVVPVPGGRTADLGWLPLLSGLAMCSALADVAGVAGRLKWPNDVMVQEGTDSPAGHGRPWLKISGTLCEMVPSGELVVIGAGTNVAQERSELPVETATSLALCGARDISREDLIVRHLGELAELHRAWSAGGTRLEALRTAYRCSCLTIGLEVDVHQPDGRVARGTATGVDGMGRLVVAAGGSSRAHAAGDVVHVRRAQTEVGHTA